MSGITITKFRKINGPLTKRIYLDAHGNVISDGSECRMADGIAQRVHLDTTSELSELIELLQSDEAIALGALAANHPDHVEVVIKHKLTALNGTPRPDLIARCLESIFYFPGQPAFALLDFDPNAATDRGAHRG